MPTKKQNLTALLQGQAPQWTPCSINMGQWYWHHHRLGTLPQPLRRAETYFDAMKALGCDIFSRRGDGGLREEPQGFEVVETQVGLQWWEGLSAPA